MRTIYECHFKAEINGVYDVVNVSSDDEEGWDEGTGTFKEINGVYDVAHVRSDEEGYYGMSTFKDGFWLDEDGQLVLEVDDYRARQYKWIPPWNILYIIKTTYDEVGDAA